MSNPSPTPDWSETSGQPEKAGLIIGNPDPQASSVANAQCPFCLPFKDFLGPHPTASSASASSHCLLCPDQQFILPGTRILIAAQAQHPPSLCPISPTLCDDYTGLWQSTTRTTIIASLHVLPALPQEESRGSHRWHPRVASLIVGVQLLVTSKQMNKPTVTQHFSHCPFSENQCR